MDKKGVQFPLVFCMLQFSCVGTLNSSALLPVSCTRVLLLFFHMFLVSFVAGNYWTRKKVSLALEVGGTDYKGVTYAGFHLIAVP